MGGRFWLGIILLVFLLISGLLLSAVLSQKQAHMTDLLNQAKTLAHNQSMEKAGAIAREAYEIWQQRWKLLAAIADHEPLDAVEAAFQEMLAFAKEADTEEFSASCGRLISGITAISQAHELAWWNIL